MCSNGCCPSCFGHRADSGRPIHDYRRHHHRALHFPAHAEFYCLSNLRHAAVAGVLFHCRCVLRYLVECSILIIHIVLFYFAVLSFHPNDFMPDGWETNPSFQGDNEWPSFFKLPVLMLMLITLLNDGTLISIGYDNVKPSKYPNVWNLRVLFTVRRML